MPATYRCSSCNATWSADRDPIECSNCGSRIIERGGNPGPATATMYSPPPARLRPTSAVSSTGFSTAYWLGWACYLLGAIATGAAGNDQQTAGIEVLFFLVGFVCLLVAGITGLVKLYRAWTLIQPLRQLDPLELDMPTPGKAVGFQFIPFYNLYWIFVAYHGLTTRGNKYLARTMPEVRPMNTGLALAFCILTLCGIIPCVGIVLWLGNMIVYYLMILDIDRFRGRVQAGGTG